MKVAEQTKNKSEFYYSPIYLREIFKLEELKNRETQFLLLIWFAAIVLSISSAAFVVIEQLSGIDLNIGSFQLHYTIYPPMIICTLLFFWLGFWWAFIPAYLSSFTVAFFSGLDLHWAIIFGFADLIPFAILSMAYRNFRLPYNLSNLKSFGFFIFIVIVGTIASSVASFIWSFSQNLDPVNVYAIWEGWWIGGIIRIGVVVAAFLFFFSKSIEKIKLKSFPLNYFSKPAFKSVVAFIILSGIIITSFVLITLILSNLEIISRLSYTLEDYDAFQLLEIINPIQLALFAGLIITAFVSIGGIYLAKSWGGFLENEVKLRTRELEETNDLLVENEKRYVKAQVLGKVGNWEYDINNDKFWASGQTKRIFGFQNNDRSFTTEYVEERIPDRERVHQALVELIEKGKEYNIIYEVHPTNGDQPKIVNSIAEIEYDAEGKPEKLIGSIKEITEEINTLEQVRESEKKYRNLFESMAQGVTYQNSDGEIISANPAAERILGLTIEQMQSKNSIDPAWKSIHEDGSDFPGRSHPSMVSLSTGEKVNNVIMGVYNPKIDDTKWIKIDAIPQFKDGGSKPFQVFTTFDDITEMKEAENALKESEEKYKNLVESSNDLIWSVDEKGIITFLNKAAKKIYGYEPEELVGKNFLDHVPPEQLKKDTKIFTEAIKNGSEVIEYQSQFIHKDGHIVYLKANSRILRDDEGNIVGTTGLSKDVTKEIQTQRQLEKEEKFQKTLIENQPNGIVACDKDGKLILFNKIAKEWHGTDISKITQDKWPEYYSLYDGTGSRLLNFDEIPLVRAFKGESVKNQLMVIKPKNNRLIYVNCNGTSFFDDEGNKLGAVIVMNDITKQLLAEKELKRSEYLLNETGNISRVGGYDLDLETMKPYFTETTFDIYELPHNRPPKVEDGIKFYAPEAQPVIQEAVQNAIETGEPYDLELPFKTAKGRDIWVRTMGRVESDEGKAVRLYGAIQDITEQIEKEELLRLNESILSASQKIAKTGGWQWDMKNEKMYWTDETYEIHDIEKGSFEPGSAELIENSLKCYTPADKLLIEKDFNECIKSGKSYDRVVPFKTRKGRELWIRTSAEAVWEENKVSKVVGVIQDITDQKIAEAKLLESEAKYRNLVESSHDLIWSVDSTGIITFMNSASKNIYGYEPDELIGKSFFDFLPEEQLKKDQEIFERSIAEGKEVIEYQSQFTHKDGHTVYLLANARLIKDEAGKMIGTSGTSKDITQLRLYRQELELSKERLESITNNLPGAVIRYVLKPDGTDELTYVSEGALDIWGVEPEVAQKDNQLIWNQIDDRDIEKVKKSIEESYTNLSHWNEEFRNNLPDGSMKWIQGIGVPKKDEAGNTVWDSLMLDITKRKHAEENLVETKILLERIINSLKEAVILIEPEDRTIKSVNAAAMEIFGYKEEELIGKGTEMLHLNEEMHKKFGEVGDPNLDETGIFQTEFQMKHKSGRIIETENRVTTIKTPGEWREGVVSVIRDITQKKRAEEELKNAQNRLRSLFKNLDEIRELERTSLAHELHDELGQVLTSLKMNLSIVRDTIQKSVEAVDPEYIINEIAEMQLVIDQSKKNVKNLIKFLRPEYLDDLGLIPALRNLLEEFRKNSELKLIFNSNIEKIKLPQNMNNIIYRVIQESLTNIAKHANAETVKINLNKDSDHLFCSISDDGDGIKKEDMRKKNSFGLLGMRERLNSINSNLEINSEMGMGTMLKFKVDIKNAEK